MSIQSQLFFWPFLAFFSLYWSGLYAHQTETFHILNSPAPHIFALEKFVCISRCKFLFKLWEFLHIFPLRPLLEKYLSVSERLAAGTYEDVRTRPDPYFDRLVNPNPIRGEGRADYTNHISLSQPNYLTFRRL